MRAMVVLVLALAGCAKYPVVIPEVRAPDPRLMAPTQQIAPLSRIAQGNEEMWVGYGQCRVAWSTEADLRRGLVDYVEAVRKR